MNRTINLDAIKSYKFNHRDESLLYYRLQIKYWDNILKVIPRWVAPNLITLIGFIAMTISCTLVLLVDSKLQGKSRWLSGVSGCLMWFYSTMDCIDGMQARRVGAGSPLGQLFDHGVDSLVCSMIVLCLCSGMGVRSKKVLGLMLLSIQSVFYWITSKEYYLKEFYIGLIGPTEAILLGCILLWSIFAIGKEKTVLFSSKNNSYLVLGMSVSTLLIWLFATLYHIGLILYYTSQIKTHGRPISGVQTNSMFTTVIDLLLPHLFFICVQVISILTFLFCTFPSNLVFYLYIGVISFSFSLFSIFTILSHQTSSKYIDYPMIIPFISVLYSGALASSMAIKNRNTMFYLLFAISATVYLYTILGLITRLLSILDINMFSIKKK
ncbi:ethanolaminephosphotransferase [Nematocida sp. AWRm80]|nr:ethanolaminephosphotransferase [Nematocida sp. AWRm80]